MDPTLRELAPEEWPDYFRGMAPLWGGGLGDEPFIAYQRRLLRSPEAVGRYRVLGLVDGGGSGRVLSAFKAYELSGEAAGAGGTSALRVLGIGAVFTPPPLRRRGHAALMLQQALLAYRRAGSHAALLFSDIGAAFYERLGFRLLRSSEWVVEASRLPRAPGARSAAPGDEAAITEVLASTREARSLHLARDGWVVRFQLRRLRELARARSVGEPEWGLVVQGRGRAAALVRLSRDAVDVLDAGWTSPDACEALFSGLRDCCQRARRDLLRAWPAHLLSGLYPEAPRPSALAMVSPLQPSVELPPPGGHADLALLDHI